jgi:hypothetical protein
LAALLSEETARVATTKLFEDASLSSAMAAGNWKQMHGLHPEIRDLLRKLLMPLAGWEHLVARDHAGRASEILLKLTMPRSQYGQINIDWRFQPEANLKRNYVTVERGLPVLLRACGGRTGAGSICASSRPLETGQAGDGKPGADK